MDNDFKKLKSLLEGAHIVSVSESKNIEAICNFCVELSDKRTSFTLYATDLGYWVGDIVCDGRHSDITDMLDSIYNHVYVCKKAIKHVSEPDTMGYFKCDCSEVFIVLEDNVDTMYKNILKDNKTMEKLADLLSDGIYFCGPNIFLAEMLEEKD